MNEQDLTATMQTMMAEMAAMRAELAELKGRANTLIQPQPQPNQPVKQKVSTTRRNTLRRLGLALLGGAATATVLGSASSTVQAKVTAHPQGGLANMAGMLVVPPGSVDPGGTAPSNSYYGLIATGDNPNTFNLSSLPVGNTGVFGQGNSYGVYGKSAIRGVYGDGNSYGVYGTSTLYGVFGNSYSGNGLFAFSSIGAPLSINSGNEPTGGTRSQGDMYVDSSGNLHIYNGSGWRTVTTTAG